MTKDLVSIIIPCYNVENFIEDCFLSLQNQTYKKIELIFINDGSKDGTLQKLQNLCTGKTNCKIIDKQNEGVSVARNVGISQAQGEFIGFVDSDDVVTKEYVEILVSNMKKFDCDCSACDFIFVKEDFQLKDIKPAKSKAKVEVFQNREESISQLFSCLKLFPTPCNKLYRHCVMQKMESYPNVFNKNINFGEDAEFNFFFFMQSQRVCYQKVGLYHYRKRKGSATKSVFSEKKLSIFLGLDNAITAAHECQPDGVIEKYARSYKGVVAMEMLYRMHSGNFQDSDKIQMVLNFLKENLPAIKACKKHARYRRWFGWMTVPYFKLMFRNELRKKKSK